MSTPHACFSAFTCTAIVVSIVIFVPFDDSSGHSFSISIIFVVIIIIIIIIIIIANIIVAMNIIVLIAWINCLSESFDFKPFIS